MWYSIIGTYVIMIIFSYLLKKTITSNKSEKYIIILIISFFFLYFGYLDVIDFINVKHHNESPNMFVVSGTLTNTSYSYDTFFYDLHICNVNKDYEYKKLVFDLNNDVDLDKITKHGKK